MNNPNYHGGPICIWRLSKPVGVHGPAGNEIGAPYAPGDSLTWTVHFEQMLVAERLGPYEMVPYCKYT